MTDLQHRKRVSRRQALAGAVAATAVGAVGVAAAMPTNEHRDAELIAAWEGYKMAHQQYRNLPPAKDGEECDRRVRELVDALAEHERVLMCVQAQTMAGVAARLSYFYCEQLSTIVAQDAMFNGTDIDDEHLVGADYRDILALDLAKNVRALAA